MTREEKLYAMTGATLIKLADELGVKAAANKARTALKESKSKVIERILEAESKLAEETEEIMVEEEKLPEASEGEKEDTLEENLESETSEIETSDIEKKVKRPSLKLTELTYNGETKSIRGWAEELKMPWPTLYDRVNRNGWTVEEAIEIPLGGRKKK